MLSQTLDKCINFGSAASRRHLIECSKATVFSGRNSSTAKTLMTVCVRKGPYLSLRPDVNLLVTFPRYLNAGKDMCHGAGRSWCRRTPRSTVFNEWVSPIRAAALQGSRSS